MDKKYGKKYASYHEWLHCEERRQRVLQEMRSKCTMVKIDGAEYYKTTGKPITTQGQEAIFPPSGNGSRIDPATILFLLTYEARWSVGFSFPCRSTKTYFPCFLSRSSIDLVDFGSRGCFTGRAICKHIRSIAGDICAGPIAWRQQWKLFGSKMKATKNEL